MQFYPADWRKDPQLQMCRMSTQGIWMNLLCLMWEAEIEGEIAGTKEELRRAVGCDEKEFEGFFEDIEKHKFGDVTNCNGNVTLICRRMKKAFLARESGNLRVKKYRRNQGNKNETPPSSSSSSSSKPILFPIPGKTCEKSGCKLPAIYKDPGGSYDHFYCGSHMPESVKEIYGG